MGQNLSGEYGINFVPIEVNIKQHILVLHHWGPRSVFRKIIVSGFPDFEGNTQITYRYVTRHGDNKQGLQNYCQT